MLRSLVMANRSMVVKQTSWRVFSSLSVKKNASALTKIVATVGPVSEQYDTLSALVHAGMDVMRINFSHATFDEANLRMTNLVRARDEQNKVVASLLDTRGPEIRTGTLRDKRVNLIAGSMVELACGATDPGTASVIPVSLASLHRSLGVGQRILLDDGKIALTVEQIADGKIQCQVLNDGELGQRKSVNVPGAHIEGLPALSDKDQESIRWGLGAGVDFIAQSFVRSADDVMELREFISRHSTGEHPEPQIISKIECQTALDNFEGILEASDGVMVARGDLGVEVPLSDVAVLQKQIVANCRNSGKPCIVATQMLESMVKAPRPTRAEACDVANAIEDGADAVMLSGESANGDYPVVALQTLDELARVADANLDAFNFFSSKQVRSHTSGLSNLSASALANAANELVSSLRPSCIICIDSADGALARSLASLVEHTPIFFVTSSAALARRMVLHRALFPIVHPQDIAFEDLTTILARRGLVAPASANDWILCISEQENGAGSIVCQPNFKLSFDQV